MCSRCKFAGQQRWQHVEVLLQHARAVPRSSHPPLHEVCAHRGSCLKSCIDVEQVRNPGQAELAGRLPNSHREERGGQAAAVREEQDAGASLQPAPSE